MGSTATAARGGDQPHPRAVVPFRPNPQFAELVRLSPMSIADEIREEHGRADCGSRRVQGHYENYDGYFAVPWLCWPCHKALHDREPYLLGAQFGNPGNPR